MSSIVLSASVRQNLLSLQSTADLLAQTQNRLSTGNKVNSALDNPTNYFTSQSLNSRASDISNLLDGISNGVQVLQAANTGITSLQKLVDSAKSVANQALQATSGYSSKAVETSAAITSGGVAVTAADLRGLGTTASKAVTGTAVTGTGGSTPLTASTTLASLGFVLTDHIGIGAYDIGFVNGGGSTTGSVLDLSVATVGDLLTSVQTNSPDSVTYSISGGKITLNGGATFDVTDLVGTPAEKLGLTQGTYPTTTTGSAVNVTTGGGNITGSTLLTGLSSAISTSDTLTVNGKTISFVNTGTGSSTTSAGATIDLASASVQDIADAIDKISGNWTSSSGAAGSNTNANKTTISSGKLVVNTGTSTDLTLAGTALTKLGLNTAFASTVTRTGLTATFTGVGTAAGTTSTITFGDGTNGTVKSLSDLNTALASLNLTASLNSSGQLAVTTDNDNASATLTAVTGTSTSGTGAFTSASVSAAVTDTNAQNSRASLVTQYNNIIQQITTTANDASFNGINLLNGDQLKLVFNETGKSTLNIAGVTDNPAGLGLTSLTTGTDFVDNAATNKVLSALNTATSTLRGQASTLGSNLSIVQIRQDFSKSLINVLQTGASNLTLADTNEEAANSQALSTRQSIAVSALSLANQSQQSVLKLLQ